MAKTPSSTPARNVRLTYATGVVLQALQRGHRYGFDIMDISGLPDGTVYPALRRLEAAGAVRSRWESTTAAQRDGRPPRRYYQLTAAGERMLEAARQRFRGLEATIPVPDTLTDPSTGPAT